MIPAKLHCTNLLLVQVCVISLHIEIQFVIKVALIANINPNFFVIYYRTFKITYFELIDIFEYQIYIHLYWICDIFAEITKISYPKCVIFGYIWPFHSIKSLHSFSSLLWSPNIFNFSKTIKIFILGWCLL